MDKKKSRKRLILGLASVLVSAGLLANLLARMNWRQTAELLAKARPGWLLLAVAVSVVLPLCNVLRWKGVLMAQDIRGLTFATALRAVLMANVLNSLLPSKAGDLAKAFYVKKHANLSAGVGTVVLERLVDLFVLGLLGMGGYVLSGVRWGLLAGLILDGGVGLAFAAVAWLPIDRLPLPAKIKRVAADVRRVFVLWIRHPAGTCMTLAGSLLNWSLGGMSVCALASAFGAPVGWAYVYGVFPLAILAGLIPLTMSGVGTRDSAFVALLMAARVSRETATLVGIGYTVCGYWLLSLICLPVVFWQTREYLAQSPDQSLARESARVGADKNAI